MFSPTPARDAGRRTRNRSLAAAAVAAICMGAVGVADALALPDGTFPVRGKHQYWDGFGAGRGHTGQDIGADCGTRIEAAQTGRVVQVARDGSGYGNYAVVNVKGMNKADFYAHMKGRAVPEEGTTVQEGERMGRVGQTGNAVGCHLHFEYWKGSYPGGEPTARVTKVLRYWDRNS